MKSVAMKSIKDVARSGVMAGIGLGVGATVLFVGIVLLETLVGQWLWNTYLVPAMPDTVRPVSFWQFLAISVLATILLKCI